MNYLVSKNKKGFNEILIFFLAAVLCTNCGKNSTPSSPPVAPSNFSLASWSVDLKSSQGLIYDVNKNPQVKFNFSTAIDRNSVSNAISFKEIGGSTVSFNISYSNGDSVVIIAPSN